MRRENTLLHFVRGLIGGGSGHREGKIFVLDDGRRAEAREVLALIRAGAIAGDNRQCAANEVTRDWYKRMQIDTDAFLAQHRVTERTATGIEINLAESPLARLAAGETAFLERHQVEAGDRVRRLVERAQLRTRLTMSYADTRTDGGRGPGGGDLSDMAVDARRAVAQIHAVLPRDCAGVVLDVCGFLKGLQDVERDRGWPRRSAKLVLRIGLDQLAQHYGLSPVAVGKDRVRGKAWRGEGARPEVFG